MKEEEREVIWEGLMKQPPLLLLLPVDQNLVTWTHLIARKLVNVFFILGSCVSYYNLGVLLLWKKNGALSKGAFEKKQ